MAERPLYTLYRNLKAQNYDVPDDYNKFESALTRDGKSGADNRHAIYENLKAQNFDVPDTYERFYSALFEPRSKTSSRAKGGSVPISAADRARFSAGAAAISASAKQIANNAGRYNLLKQRKQKQQKDFGRVKLGTHLTPFGGDANNVVKDEFAYNPDTGKAGAYVTSDNENVYSLPEAEQSQAHDVAYQQAVDAGEIPSVFDVRDKNGNYDLQENIGKNGTYLTEEGAQKQFDKKLEDAYARKKEIEAAIAEDHRLHGNPLLSYGASIGASNGRTAEQSDYSNKLTTSLALVKQQIGAMEAVKQYHTSSWGEDVLKALDNTAFTAKTWDFGLTDFATMGQMERIKTKMDNNILLSGSDKMLLNSKLGADAAAALEDEKMGNIYRWTKIAGQSLPFMADFFLTGGYGGITKGISRGALKFAAKRGMGKVSAAILKNTGIVAGDIIGSYAMAGTEQAMKTGADIMQRHLGNLYQDEKGDYKFGTFDENGNLLHEGGESMGSALYKGLTSAMVENYTEKLFGHNYGIKKGAVNFMEKHGMNASAEFFKNIGKSGWYTNSKKWMEKFGINGFGEEVMEEEIGIPLHALLDGDNNFSDLGDAKQQLDIIGGMAISVGSMYAMGAGSRPVKGIYNRAQYYRFRNKVNVADNDAQNLIGDNWAYIKDKIDNATNEQMGGVLSDILRQRDTMTKEQINAAVNYGVNLMKMRGYNIAKTAEMNAKEITNEPTTPEEQHQADIDNAYSEGHDADDADKHDIQVQHEDQAKTLAAALNISEQQLSGMSDEELESMTGQDDKLDKAIYDYQLSSARYQGVVDDAQDKVDIAAHQAAQKVDMYTDRSRGSVRNATIKASGGVEDYGVYIISGNIATHDDGSIDVSNSDDMILYFDPTTNSVEHADALMFAELGEELPADDVKAQAVADAKENAIKEVAGIIDGTVEVGSQFSVTDADGTEHTYEVLADNGDGTAMITIDGNVPTELVKGENVQIPYSFADLQQMKDLEDQKRLESAKTEREQMEKERTEQQNQETEQTQPSFDFNQILNDNGNVVLVDVLGKDGNTKYPGSKLFLIRDAGAKAKVVELKSDGTIVPHAVNKEDVATISSMSLDEYKQAMPSSMIEENSGENRGEIEVESPAIEDETTPEVADNTESTTPADETAETPETEQTPASPAITLEDGTIVPILDDGNPDFSKLTAAQTAELYDTEFGEDAYSIVSGYVSDAKKALDKANNMTVKGKTFVEQKASKDAKEKAIADAQAAYDSAIAIRDAYNERQLAKVEDTADGRKSLIDKARRKFARLKSSVKDDAEAVAKIYKETVGSLLHRLYDSTGIDVTDTIPLTAEEYVASNLGAHSLNYEGTETSKGVKQETGLSREDFAKTQLLAADGKGTTIDALVHSLWENRPSNLDSLDTQDIRNALIGVLTSGFKASEARSYVENIRIAQAEKLIEEERTAAENAAYYEQQKAKEEEEKKKAELEKKAEEEKSDEKLDNESSNESNDLSNESDNKKKNDNINDNINSLTPEQHKAKEDGEKLGFPAVDKEGEPINQNVIELANWAKEQGLEIDPTSKLNSYADLFVMCKDGFGVSTLVPDVGEDINQVFYLPDNVQGEQLLKLQEEFNVGRNIKHSADMNSELTEGAMFYDGDTAREFKEFVDKKVEEQNKVFGEQIPETDLPFSAKENGTQQTTAERAADVEKNKVDDMKVVDNIVGNKTRKAFDRLAKMMGANIQWQYSDKLGNGWIQETTDADGNVHRTIFITLDSSITEGAQFIFGHEMTHRIKNLNPAAYNELTQLVLDTYGSDAFDKAVDETMKRYSDAGFSGRNRDYYAEEVVADAVGEMIRDLNLAHTLAMKMSHPLLAAIHEILQKIKLAFFGTEYSDVTKNIIRSIEQAYVKTANREAIDAATQEGEGGQRLSLRTKPEPKKTQKVYKLMRLGEDGKLYPLFIGSGEAIELGKWYDADSPKLQDLTSLSSKDYVGTRTAKKDGASVKEEYHYGVYIVNNKTGEAMSLADFKAKYSKQFARMGNNPNKKAVDWATDNGYRWIKIEEKNQGQSRYGGEARSYYNYGINGSGSVSIFAMRPGWHAGSLPTMRQIGKGSAKNLRDDTFVWVEGEIPADIDYNEEAQKNADKDIPDHIPTDGYYLKATNANKEASQADKVGWYVAGAFRANRIMSDKETRDIIDEWNAAHPDDNVEYDWKRESGKDFNAETMSLEDTPKFSLKVYHGSGADFTEFDFDHMGEGAGSQVFGWGGYVTSSKKIGKSYAEVGQQSAESRHAYSEDTPIEAAVGSILGQDMYNHQAKTFEQKKAQAIKNAENSIASFSDMLKNSNELDEKGKNFLQKSIEKDKKELEVLRTLTEEQYKEEYIKQGRAKNLYEVDIPDDNGRNYLKWYETLSEEQINTIRDALAKKGVDVSSWEKRGFKLDLPFKDVYTAVLPMMMRCEPKEVSKFLSSLGFTGIKYPAGTIMGGAEENDTNYVIFKPEDMKITEHTKFSIKTYHGSQASFDHFDHSFMGSGEGAQAYGWGTYVSEVEGIAKAYAKQNAAKHGIPREYKIAQLHLNHAKYEYDKVQRAYDNSKAYIDSLKEDLQNYRESIDRRKEKVAYFAQNNMTEAVDKLLKQIKRTEDTIKVTENDINMRTNDLEGWKRKLEEVKKKYEEEQKKFDAIPKPQIDRNLYSVDIPDDTGENYIGWDEKMTPRMRDIRKEILEDNGYKLVDSDGTRDYFEDRDGKEYDLFKEQYKTGGTFYEELAQLLHSQKLASLALKEYGFDGVKVIAERNTGGNKEGKMNYVIFDENNAKITSHTKFSLKSKPVRFEAGKKLSDEEKKEVLSTLKDAYKVNGVPYHIEETAGGKEKKVYEPTADSYVVSDITNRPLRYYITLPDGRVAHPTEVYPNISDNEVKSSATKQGLLDNEADHIVSTAIGNMKDIADNTKAIEVLTELQNLPHDTRDVGYGMNNAQSYNYKTGIFTSDTVQAIDYVVRRMRRKEDVPSEIPAALKKAVADSYGMVDNLIDGMSSTKFSLRLKSAIEETETNPSDAQKESGNYKKGHIKFGGYDYTIENPKGSTRSGKDANGKEWKVTMHDTYGYIRGKFGKDGDHLDMFINDKADLDNWDGDVFVVDQVNPDGSFDEHKVMYGYDSMNDAEKAYLANYSKGWKCLGNITGASKAEFDKWLDTSNRKLKPFADYANVKFSQAQSVDNEEPKTFEEFLNHPLLKFSIKNEEQRNAAENAYKYAAKLRPNKYAQYAIVDMGMPSKVPEYYEKKVLADNWRRFYNRAVHNELKDVRKKDWGNYKLFDLDRPFAEQVNEVKGDVPDEFNAPDTATNKDNIKGLYRQVSSVAEPRYSLKDEKIKSVTEKFGVNEDDVAMYANAVEKGSTADAARARANIKRYLLQANEDKISSLKDIIKYTKPINEALKENFGDLDAMIEERRKQVEAQRNAMEAARKRAQEEEEKRQKHLDELSLIPTDELDKRYMDAIANNDESTAREMLDESARRNGYGDVDSDYQGKVAWAAPSNPQYESDEARRADIENSPDVNLEDIALGYNLQPDDYFDNPRAYMNNTAYGLESAHVIKNALDSIKNGEKDVKVKVYRAVPTSVKEGNLRNGDWVTPSKKYAEMHGDNRLEGKYRIIEDEVPANQLWWDGNDANEFGFDDGKEYRYKNAKNNRKLNDLITYDNKGNVIPPSKRFNSRKSDIRFSLAGERGAADMAEDLKSLNTPDEVDDAIKTAIDDMPSGWKMANRKMIHIAQALGENRKAEIAGEDPKFSLKDGTLIKAGTYFSGGGLVEEGLKGIIDPVVAVEYDEKISGVYRNNFGKHIVTADVRDVDPKDLVKQIDGEVEYFHASPVCKNYSQAKSNHAELEIDKETAASTAEFINAIKPKVVTIENVKGYKDSEAMKTITDALDANGYTWDADVYNAADYGGYTNRERLIVRAVRDGKLPAKPKKMAHKSGWYEAVDDIIPTLTEKKNGVAPWMDIRLKADGIDWRNIDKPLYVMGSAYADGKIPHAFADELLPTLRTKSGDVIVMPDGKVYRAMGRVLARVSGVSDDYKMPFSENLSHTIIGNGIPTQLTEYVIGPLLTASDPKFSIRTYHGTGAKFDKFDLSHALEGEGSESFGHGVYVTNSSKIGREYAQRAKNRKMEDLYKNMRYPDGVKGDIFKRRVFGEMVNDVATGGSVASAKDFAKKRVGADANDIQRTLENLNDRDKGTEYEQNLKDRLAEYKEGLKWIDSIDEEYLTQGNANRYDVDIPDDNGINYLDWEGTIPDSLDKQKVTEDAYKVVSDNQGFKDSKVTTLNDFIAHTLKNYVDTTDVSASVEKLKSDIKDVIEDDLSDDDVLALNEYLKDATTDDVLATIWYNDLVRDIDNSETGEELYRKLSTYVGDNAASQILSDNGLVGIKYPAGMIHGGAEEGDYNYVIFDENNANIVGNTRFSLRYDQFEHDLNQWKKDNNLPKDAQRPTIPQRNAGESAVDFLRRVDEYRKQMALWKTAPTYEQHLLSDDTALGEFNRELQRGSVLKRIAFQDSMLAIRKAQEAIMKEVGVDRLNMAEDAYTAENRSHGKGKNEFEEYNNEFLQPLRKAYHQMKKVLGDSYDNVRIYMMAKHGLERDAQMAFKMSLDADYEDVAQRSAAYRAYKGDMNRITNDSDLEFGRVDFNTWRQRDNALRAKYSPSYMNYRYDKDGTAYDYSGLSALFGGTDFEEAASKLVKDIESSHVVEVQDLWNATNAATKKILRDGYKAGMMSKDTYQYVRDMYSHYIPLRGWDGTTADQVWDYVGGGNGAFNQTLKTAHGRTSIADDPIAYIENMAESGILLNNKNWVKQHLMLLAQNHPTSLLTLSKAWYVKSTDVNGNEEWIPATPQITSQMNSNQVKAAIDAFEQKMEQMAQTGDATQKRDGLNIAYPQTHSEEREHEVRVMKDGEEYVIYVNGDPQLAQAMNNTRAHRVREIQSGKLDKAAAWLGRKMAAVYTSLSPLFIPSNYFRDLTMTLASTAIREDAKYNYLLRKNLATSWNLGFMLRDYQNGKLREKVSNGNATPKEQMFYDFMMNGGETGFVSSLDVEDLKKKFKNDLKDLDRWKANPVKVGHIIMDSIEFLNRAIEDSNRFAVYMTSIQYGRSIDEAVNDAKNVTLNFNRKGTGEYGWQMIRNLYLFINPAVQSLHTLGALAKHHPFKFTAVTASWLASGVMVPIVNAAMMSLLGGDDDKDKYWQFSKWDRRNNFIMWVPTTNEFVKIPLAQEFRAFYGLGDMIASKMMGGELAEESWVQYGEDLLGQVVDMLPLDPTGYDGNIAVSLMPNAIRPVFELAFNVDFTGKPLFKDTEYNKYDPNFTKAYVGTPDWLVRASRMVNSIGNDYPDVQQNSIDAFGDPRYNLNNPAVVDHVLSSYLGGAYTIGSQVLGLLTKSLNDPKEIKVADIPLFSKFVSNPDDRPVTKKQGDEFWNMKENHDRAANTLSKLKKQAKVDGDYSMLERFYGSEEYKQYKQDDVKVKKYEEDKKKERADESGEEYRPHKLNAEDIYKAHATPKDDFEDLKLKQLYTKLNGFKTSYDLLVDTAPSQSDGYYNTNKAAIDAIDEISLDKQEISELKKGFLDDGKDAYNAEDMRQIRELRKKILAVLEKANKVVVANQKANAKKK